MMLELHNVSAGYAGGFMLNDVSLTVQTGELVGVVGPNGSGKTTLLRVGSRALRPRSGIVRVDGRDIWQEPSRALAKVMAVVTQHADLVPMTVEEHVLLGRVPHHGAWQFLDTTTDRQLATRAMAQTECEAYRDHLLTEISGGERQLAFIARALAQEPKVLLLDEPTSYLDIAHQVRVLDLIRRLKRELGLTVIMVMHDLNAASEYCDRLVLMARGRVQLAGPADTVMVRGVLEEIYGTPLVVGQHATTGRPHVFPVSAG